MTSTIGKIQAGQVVLVTAGASGIGRFIAERFLEHDCKVHICDISEDKINVFLEENPTATASLADICDNNQVEQLFRDLVSKYDGLDILINNAGIAGPTAPVEEIQPEEWDRTIAVDLNGHFYCTRLAVPLLKSKGAGCIINISSNAAFFGFPLRSPYTAAKWALIGLTKTWAMELGSHNIRVNAICPGSVKGDRIDSVIEREASQRGVDSKSVRQSYLEQSSMRLFVDPEDVASMAVFLCSDLGASLSGQAIGVDGHTENLSNKL
jgi:NAD(P)-dependent dehydrogenase (short-subunit alcohol dehydrogenase family)